MFGARCIRRLACALAACALVAESSPANADDPAPAPAPRAPPLILTPRPRRSAWQTIRAGSDLIDSVPTAAVIDGSWSIALHVNTELTNRTWDAPYPWGTIGQYSTRLLYGLGWTTMLGIESVALVLATGGTFDWLAEASYRSDWGVPIDLPACPWVGAYGGCGMGIGSFAFIQLRPRGSRIWYEAGGGWIQQRVFNDALRTVAESTWVLSPITATWDLHTDLAAPVAFRTFVGPGLFFGMHNAHMHPTLRGADVYPDVPWTEMYPLDAGIGPGGRIEGRLIFARHLTLEGELVVAPFVLGAPVRRASKDVAPLDFDREGMSVWRKYTVGIGWDDPRNVPFKLTVATFAAELSERPVERIGYRGVMLRFDIPLRVPN